MKSTGGQLSALKRISRAENDSEITTWRRKSNGELDFPLAEITIVWTRWVATKADECTPPDAADEQIERFQFAFKVFFPLILLLRKIEQYRFTL